MEVNIKDVEYIAKLARLEFNDEEKKKLTIELNEILKYVEKLSNVDTTGLDTDDSYIMNNALREDEIEVSMEREVILKNAPNSKAGYIKVPKMLE